jgi:hypothetical protein
MKFYSILKSTLQLFFLALTFGVIELSNVVFAQSNPSFQEDIEFSQKWEAKLSHATAPNHSHTDRSDKTYRSCLSLVIWEGIKNKNRLTPRLQKVLKTYEDRPSLSFSADSRHFRFHYDKTGNDAVSSTDNNDNDIPDYVEFMAFEFENVHKKEIEDLGFVVPPSDDQEGGNDLYDVYISDIQQGVYGFVSPETTIGDNPNSSAVETQASTSWMAMRNNYDDFSLQDNALKVTAAHEFFHSIQLGYNAESPSAFAFEGSASWMEEAMYPGIDDNFQYLESVLGSPDVALNYDFSDDNDPDFNDFSIQWYGSWIFFQYIGENYGKDVIRKFWENLRSQSELQAFNAALLTKNVSLNTAFEDFFVANVVLSASSASNPFVYARAADYINYLRETIESETVRIEGNINFIGQSTTWNSNSQGNKRLMRFSADYIKLNTQEEEFKVEIIPDAAGSEIGIQFVSFQPNGQVRVIKNYPNAGTTAKIDVKNVNSTDKMYLIVYRLGQLGDDFTSKQYRLRIASLSEVTGIEDNLGANNYFNIASNPISDNLSFVYQLGQLQNQNLESYKVNVTDALGRTMIENKSVDKSISTIKWAKGTYFVTLLYNQKPVVVRKIVVR